MTKRRPDATRRCAFAAASILLFGGLTACSDDGSGDAGGGTTSAVGTEPSTPTSAGEPTVTSAASEAPLTADPADTAPDRPADTSPDTSPDAEPAAEPALTHDFSAVTPIVQGYLDEHGFAGAALVVVTEDEGIVHEEYWGTFDAERISFVASSSKMVTAGVLMHLADEGLLDMDAPVADVVDWGSGNPTITPAQLVSNSSGLIGLGPAEGFQPPYLCQYQFGGTMQECAEAIFTTTDDDLHVVPPDTEYRYGGAQWQIAGAVAEVVSGKTWAQLIDEIYVRPCGLGDFAYNNQFTQLAPGGFVYPEAFDGDLSVLQPTDNPNMEGGLYSTPTDYAQLLLMHLRDGRCGDEQVLSPEAVQRMHTDRVGPTYGGTTQVGTGYGMGWWTGADGSRIFDPGAYGSFPWLELDDGFGAILVLEENSTDGAALAAQLFDPVAAAALS